MNITLKEMINTSKKYDNENNITTEIKVLITSTHCEGKRKTIFIDPESDAFIDRIAMIGFENCSISDIDRHVINDKENMMIVIIDLDRQ